MLLLLIPQIAIIIIAARLVGALFRRFGQPQVVGEMLAGILLGPSLFGWLMPELSAALFPADSLRLLNVLSQIGLVLFMFLVGLEFDSKLLKGRTRAAVVTSHVSIVAPFFLGAALALFLYPRLSDASVSFTGFALFMGAAMSITAFPVLARILAERNLMKTRLGAVAIACAAVDDVTAWCILAAVLVIVRSGAVQNPLWVTLLGSAAYIVLLLFVVRRGLIWLERWHTRRGRLTQDMVAVALLALLGSAWVTEWLGIHALFGAFAIGAVMPKERGFAHDLAVRLEDLTVVFLLPIFFAFTGLRTSIGLVSGAEMWGYFALIMLVAVAGKLGGSAVAARATGLGWREASAVGILMNTRGLMELVILSIGFELGLITPALFTMMVMMAVVTTLMATPILRLLYPRGFVDAPGVDAEATAASSERKDTSFTVLVPISLPRSAPGLYRAARALTPPGRTLRLRPLYIDSRSDQRVAERAGDPLPRGEDPIAPLVALADRDRIETIPERIAARDPGPAIVDAARRLGVDTILMGSHQPVIGKQILKGTVADILKDAPADTMVFVERGEAEWRAILLPFRDDPEEARAFSVAQHLSHELKLPLTLLPPVNQAGGRLPGSGPEELVVLGVDGDGVIPSHPGRLHESDVQATPASLLLVRQGGGIRP